jgi:TonB family protein
MKNIKIIFLLTLFVFLKNVIATEIIKKENLSDFYDDYVTKYTYKFNLGLEHSLKILLNPEFKKIVLEKTFSTYTQNDFEKKQIEGALENYITLNRHFFASSGLLRLEYKYQRRYLDIMYKIYQKIPNNCSTPISSPKTSLSDIDSSSINRNTVSEIILSKILNPMMIHAFAYYANTIDKADLNELNEITFLAENAQLNNKKLAYNWSKTELDLAIAESAKLEKQFLEQENLKDFLTNSCGFRRVSTRVILEISPPYDEQLAFLRIQNQLQEAEKLIQVSKNFKEQLTPTLVNCPRPEYPKESRIKGEEGTVTVKLKINKLGDVENGEIVSTSKYKNLDEVTLKAFTECKFKPPLKDGYPIESTGQLRFTFKLEN